MDGKTLKERLTRLTKLQMKIIAEKMDMSPQLLNQALNATDVKSGFVEHLCEVLNLSLSDLYDESTNNVSNVHNSNLTGVNVTGKDIHINPDAYNTLLKIVENNQKSTEKFQEQIDRLITLLEKK